jgi:NADH:quinone reductase (non-electrogenic)
MIAELFDLARDVKRYFPGIRPEETRFVLVHSGDRILPEMSPQLGAYALAKLQTRGIEFLLGRRVAGATAGSVSLTDGTVIPTRTLVWTAGVVATPLAATLGGLTGSGGRIAVAPDLSVPGHPEVFAVGDVAICGDGHGGSLPGVAQVAIQGGRHAGRMIRAQLDGRPTTPFRYRDKGSMATIGRHDAVAELPGGIRLTGAVGWLAWLGLHLLYLIGFRNRANVLVNWAWNYLTYDRGSRIIGEGVDEVT